MRERGGEGEGGGGKVRERKEGQGITSGTMKAHVHTHTTFKLYQPNLANLIYHVFGESFSNPALRTIEDHLQHVSVHLFHHHIDLRVPRRI